LKTTVQIIAIVLLILDYPVFLTERMIDLHSVGTIVLWFSAILAIISAFDYSIKFWMNVKRT